MSGALSDQAQTPHRPTQDLSLRPAQPTRMMGRVCLRRQRSPVAIDASQVDRRAVQNAPPPAPPAPPPPAAGRLHQRTRPAKHQPGTGQHDAVHRRPRQRGLGGGRAGCGLGKAEKTDAPETAEPFAPLGAVGQVVRAGRRPSAAPEVVEAAVARGSGSREQQARPAHVRHGLGEQPRRTDIGSIFCAAPHCCAGRCGARHRCFRVRMHHRDGGRHPKPWVPGPGDAPGAPAQPPVCPCPAEARTINEEVRMTPRRSPKLYARPGASVYLWVHGRYSHKRRTPSPYSRRPPGTCNPVASHASSRQIPDRS